MRVADYIIEILLKFNVNCTHIVTGRGSLFLTDAVKIIQKCKHVFFIMNKVLHLLLLALLNYLKGQIVV